MGHKINKIGMSNLNTFGTEMIIVKELEYPYVIVEFQDENKFNKETTYSNFNKGSVKNPFDISVLGKGYIGNGKYLTKISNKRTVEYSIWTSMMDRCYGEREQYPAYIDNTEVCKEWLNFQIFSEWFNQNKYDVGNERLHLDKDIQYKGNRIYSPHHCILIPQLINEQFKDHSGREKQTDIDLPYTIRRNGGIYSVSYRGYNLGNYDSVDKCVSIYLVEKKKYLRELIEKYENMPEEVKQIILNTNR